MIFNWNDNAEATGICGIIYSLFVIFFGLCLDFFEPLNTLCLPFLAMDNFRLYTIKIWKVALWNLGIFLACLMVFALFKNVLFRFPKVLSLELMTSVNHLYTYIFLGGVPSIINNFLRGIFQVHNFRSHHQH